MCCLYSRPWRFLFYLSVGVCLYALPARSQTAQQEPLPGPDSHETGHGPHGHLWGTWGGERTRLEERGVTFDFQYVSDSLWNLNSVQKERFWQCFG
jgi:porin